MVLELLFLPHPPPDCIIQYSYPWDTQTRGLPVQHYFKVIAIVHFYSPNVSVGRRKKRNLLSRLCAYLEFMLRNNGSTRSFCLNRLRILRDVLNLIFHGLVRLIYDCFHVCLVSNIYFEIYCLWFVLCFFYLLNSSMFL